MADWLGAAIPLISQFNANQNARMNAREARQWEEDMYNKYNSPAAMVRQYEEAGLNPALMYGNAPIAAPTDTAAAETMAPNTGTLTEMLGSLLQLNLFGEEYEAKKLENENRRIKNDMDRLNYNIQSKVGLIKENYSIAQVIASINKLEEETELTRYEYSELGPLRKALYRAQARGENVAAALDEWRKSTIDKTGNDPMADWHTQVASMLIDALADILEGKGAPKSLEDNPYGYHADKTLPNDVYFGVK